MRTRNLISAIALASSVACMDADPTAPAAAPTIPVVSAELTLIGTLLVASGGDSISPARLHTANMGDIPLAGDLELLKRVEGTEVAVYGKFESSYYDAFTSSEPVFDVINFEVRGANGMPAWDGILETRADAPDAYGLRLRDGSLHNVKAAPAEFAALVGSRVWVAEAPDGDSIASFGVIEPLAPMAAVANLRRK